MQKPARMEVRLSQRLKDGLLRESGIAGLSLNAYVIRVLRNRRWTRRRNLKKEE